MPRCCFKLSLSRFASVLVAIFITVGPATADSGDYEKLSMSQLESRLFAIDRQLIGLATYSLRSGVGSIGYRSDPFPNANQREWIRIEFDSPVSVDAVALVPVLLRDPVSGFRAEGFPEEFQIVVGSENDAQGTVVASFTAEDALLPRVAPLVVSLTSTRASWVMIDAAVLTPRQFDKRYLLQFAEILVFDKDKNVALGQTVKTSSKEPIGSHAYNAVFVTDGFTPYLMNGTGGRESLAFVVECNSNDEVTFTIDLEATYLLEQANLHLVDQSDTVPQTFSGDFGVPRRLLIEGSQRADFSDAAVLADIRHDTIYDTGPILFHPLVARECRYVRLTAQQPYTFTYSDIVASRFGLAEFELIADGKNVALGKVPQTDFEPNHPRSPKSLTDGNNFLGKILPLRVWMEQLAKRHDLETERPRIEAELALRYQQQQANFNRLAWVAGLLALAALAAVVIGWNLRQRAIFKTRERIAADLHDELGANMHAIGLLSDLAHDAVDSPQRLQDLMTRMRELTQRTGKAAAYVSNMLESEGLFGDLEEEMHRTSSRILADIDHTILVTDDGTIARLQTRRRNDLFLFYKECITNVLRHSSATEVTTKLIAERDKIELVVTDNGTGINTNNGPRMNVPRSLRRRARLLGATASAQQQPEGGTKVILRMQVKHFQLFTKDA